MYSCFYVYDILVAGENPSEISNMIRSVNSTFVLKDLGGVNLFLGIEANVSEGLLQTHAQTKYIKDTLVKASMDSSKPMPIPMISDQKLSARSNNAFHNLSLYRSVVGVLQYVTITRQDLTYVVNHACQFMCNPPNND